MKFSFQLHDKRLEARTGSCGYTAFFESSISVNNTEIAEIKIEYSEEEEKSIQAALHTADIDATLLKKSLSIFYEVK